MLIMYLKDLQLIVQVVEVQYHYCSFSVYIFVIIVLV